MKVLELFSGTRSIGKAFERRGHEVYSVDWDTSLEHINWNVDIGIVTAIDIIERFGVPDVIWASPDCTSYSVAAIYHHRRREADGNLVGISEYAKFCDEVNTHMINLIKELNPKVFFIENPRGAFRKMNFIQHIPRYTVTYCQYGFKYMKPTDLFTNHPNPKFKPACKNGDKCHVSAPRGSTSGLQGKKTLAERFQIPVDLCNHIVDICEELFE
jgi:hypothetical protein